MHIRTGTCNIINIQAFWTSSCEPVERHPGSHVLKLSFHFVRFVFFTDLLSGKEKHKEYQHHKSNEDHAVATVATVAHEFGASIVCELLHIGLLIVNINTGNNNNVSRCKYNENLSVIIRRDWFEDQQSTY